MSNERSNAARSLAYLFQDAADAPDRRVRPVVGGLLVFLIGFLGTCMLVDRAFERIPGLRLEEPGTPRIKAQHLEEHLDRYDLVFVGSSRVFRQLRPVQFDARLAEHGVELTSYNLGLPGARFYETLHMVERLLAHEPERLRHVVVELMHPDPPLIHENLLARKEIAWHTPSLTGLALRRVLASERDGLEKVREVRGHLQQLACAVSNIGDGRTAAEALLEGVEVPEDSLARGWFPLGGEDTIGRRREFLEELNADRELLARRAEALRAEPRSRPPDALLVATLEGLVERVRAHGVEPVFVVLPPIDSRLPEVVGAHEEGVLPNLFHYADPDRYPEFYLEFQSFFDRNHLDAQAASQLTRTLADDLAPLLAGLAGLADGERD